MERERERTGKFALRCWQSGPRLVPSLRERRPDSATGGNPSRDLASMSRIRQKLDIQYEAQRAGDFKLAAGERGILQESKFERRGSSSVAESPSLCMRCGPLALLVIQIGEGISSGAILAHSAIGMFAPFIEQFPFYSRMTPSYSRHGRRRRRCPSVRPFGALKERAPHYAG